MCACRLECSSLSSSPRQFEFDEDYVLRSDGGCGGGGRRGVEDEENRYREDGDEDREGDMPKTEEDFRDVLEQKDSDLRLAAELGKALLERNIELERRNEQLSEEYCTKLEDLEQERHCLHLKLESLEGEYENTVKELQYDINQLRQDLVNKRKDSQGEEKEKAERTLELSLQNDRLTEEIQQAAKRQAVLEKELKFVTEGGVAGPRGTVSQRQLETLEHEVETQSKRNTELERQLSHVSDEKESILCCLEEAQDRVRYLERQKHEHEQQDHNTTLEIQELRQANTRLTIQLDQLTAGRTQDSSSGHSQTLFNELSEISGLSEPHGMTTESHTPFRMEMFSDDDDIECDDDDCVMMTMSDSNQNILQEMTASQNHDSEKQLDKLKGEITEVYTHLNSLCEDIRTQLGHHVTREDGGVTGQSSSMRCESPRSMLLPTIEQLRELLSESLNTEKTPSYVSEICALQGRVNELERDLRHCQTGIQRLQEQIHQKDIQLREKSEKMSELSKVLGEQQTHMKKLSEERDHLQDMVLGDLDTGDVIEQARTDRDQAIVRRTNMEGELLEARLDVLTLHGQLMEAIQQKITVTQQLDQWQVDMEEMLGIQMYKQFKEEMNQAEKLQKQQGRKSRSLPRNLTLLER